MLCIGKFSITDDLQLSIGDRAVQLRPAQGLRAAEKLIRSATRAMMTEEADRAAAPAPARSQRKRRAVQ
jgi:hypothetical protein